MSYRREHTETAIFVLGELLCKVEYANWHPKYVCMKNRKAKYI